MNKFHKFMGVALIAALPLAIVSCSDDDKDEPDPNPGSEQAVNPKNVFSQGAPSQVGGLVITKNANGLVTKIVEDDEVTMFDYTPAPKAKSRATVNIPTDYDMTMNVTWGNDKDGVDFYIRLNKQGFIEYAYEVDEDEYDGIDTDEWWFKYNSDGQMIEMKRSEGGNEITTITYTNGDITKVVQKDDEGDQHQSIISYTNTENPAAIENKSGIMLYDHTFRIDMDEMAPAYFAGLLGKGTKHLPVATVEDNNDFYAFTWTLDSNKMPVKWNCVNKYDGHEEHYEMTLKW